MSGAHLSLPAQIKSRHHYHMHQAILLLHSWPVTIDLYHVMIELHVISVLYRQVMRG